MSSSVIGALRANLGLDSAQFERGTGRAQKSLRTMRNQFAAVAGAAAALGTAIAAMARNGANEIDRVVKGARRIDGTAGAFQALELAAGDAGVSLSGLTNDIQTMNRELSSGSAGAVKALDRLGMSAEQLLAMDADERVAVIADRVKELGLSAGEATDLLRDLGIRNREMALLMIQGGDAIRSARDDIRSYGLEIDDALGAKIEQANDRIARLGIVAQYLGQRLAAELVPAMGEFALSITEAMREGGALRGVIDGLVDNLQLMTTIVAVAVTAFGVRYVGALVAAKLATFTLTGALVALRTALLRTGIGALIVGAGVLVDYLIRLRTATGSWGEALSALGDVASAVWEGIKTSAKSIAPALASVWESIKRAFNNLMSDLTQAWASFLNTLANAGNKIPLLAGQFDGLTEAASRATEVSIEYAKAANTARDESERLATTAKNSLSSAFDGARKAMAELNKILDDNIDGTTDAADAARVLSDEIDKIAGSGGGGGGGAAGAAEAVDGLTESINASSQASQQAESAFRSAFVGFVTGARSAREAAGQLLSQLAQLLANQAFTSLLGGVFGGSGGGGIGGLLGNLFSFDGGGYTGNAPRTGGLDGKGGFLAMMHPRETVIDHTKGGSGGALDVRVYIDEGGNWQAEVERISGNVSASVVRSFDRGLPARVASIVSQPRVV